MKQKKLIVTILVVIMLLSTSIVAYAATKDAYVAHMHTDDYRDATYFTDLLDDKSYSTTEKLGSSATSGYFDNDDKTVLYWSAHGNSSGYMWGGSGTSFNAPAKLEINGTSSDWVTTNQVSKSDWDDDIEFVFISACNQLHSNVRYKYARAMLGDYRVRVISAYHDYAPGSSCDYKVTQKFEDYADNAQSVKYSWMQANEYWASQGYTNPNHYCVLTFTGSVQYSRMPGFGGSQYTRPDTSDYSLLRFSQVNSSGTSQGTSKSKSSSDSTLFDNEGLILNCEYDSKVSIPDYQLTAALYPFSINSNSKYYADMAEIKSQDDEMIFTTHEMTDSAVKMDEKVATAEAIDWMNSIYGEKQPFTDCLYETIPLVVANVDLDGKVENEIESTFGYSVRFVNEYNGVRVLDNFNTLLVDKDGVASSMLKWNEFETLAYSAKTAALDFDKVVGILSDNIDREPIHLSKDVLDDAITVEQVELVFTDSFSKDNSTYTTAWMFNMRDGTRVLVDAHTGEALIER